MIVEQQVPTSDERIIAAISHLLGFLVALVFWVTQKDKSRFVRFQAVQAMAFDAVVSAVFLLVIGSIFVMAFVVLALGIGDIAIFGNQNPTAEPFRVLIALTAGLPFLIPCIVIPLAIVIFVARLIASVETFQGKDFHYPWLGNLIEKSLER